MRLRGARKDGSEDASVHNNGKPAHRESVNDHTGTRHPVESADLNELLLLEST